MIKSVTVAVGDQELVLSAEEAQDLLYELERIYGPPRQRIAAGASPERCVLRYIDAVASITAKAAGRGWSDNGPVLLW